MVLTAFRSGLFVRPEPLTHFLHADGLPFVVSGPVSSDLRMLSGAAGAVAYDLEQPMRLTTASSATNNHSISTFIFSFANRSESEQRTLCLPEHGVPKDLQIPRPCCGLNLPEPWLVESSTTVIIPFDDRVFFVSSLNCAQFPIGLSKVAQTLDPISGSQFLARGRGLGERWLPGSV